MSPKAKAIHPRTFSLDLGSVCLPAEICMMESGGFFVKSYRESSDPHLASTHTDQVHMPTTQQQHTTAPAHADDATAGCGSTHAGSKVHNQERDEHTTFARSPSRSSAEGRENLLALPSALTYPRRQFP